MTDKHTAEWEVEREHRMIATCGTPIETRVTLPTGLRLYSWESVEIVKKYLFPALSGLNPAGVQALVDELRHLVRVDTNEDGSPGWLVDPDSLIGRFLATARAALAGVKGGE